ncbi:MAG: hypothetical protein EXS27_07535 [Pedosphaera sp.]|nr:hypothetical protein [Pedosphaera sp.]
MKPQIKLLVLAITGTVLAALLATTASAANEAKASAAKVAMQKFHKAPKGVDPTCKKISEGKASKEELEQVLAAYRVMAAEKPVRGDEASWKEKCAALIKATESLVSGKPEGVNQYKAAVNCKGCHSVHKPEAPKAK